MTKKHSATLIAAVSMTLLTASAAHAIDGWSGDYTPLPAGSSAGLMYFQYNNSGTYRADGSDVANSSLDYSAITARFVHYFELGGKPAALQAYVPIVDYFDPEIGGANLATADGWGDLTLGASYWVMSAAPDDATGTTLAGSLFLTLPTGDYEYGSVSSGSGTTTITPQIGLQQGLGNGLFMDVIYDVAFAVDHNEGGLEISTDPAHQLQGYLRYQQSARTGL